jgi:hypothetical protein
MMSPEQKSQLVVAMDVIITTMCDNTNDVVVSGCNSDILLETTDHSTRCDNDDGFIPMGPNKKKKKNQFRNNQSTKRNTTTRNGNTTTLSSSCCTSSYTSNHSSTNGIRFGANRWAKPTIQQQRSSEQSSSSTSSSSSPTKLQGSFHIGQSDSTTISTTTYVADNNVTITTTPSLFIGISDVKNMTTQINDNITTHASEDDCMKTFQVQSLSTLMEEYGTYDPNWMKVEPVVDITTTETTSINNNDNPTITHDMNEQQQIIQEMDNNTVAAVNGINRLQLHGHAPIHVEFVSFGYRHGVPSDIRYYSTGNCYRQPLLPFDIRTTIAPIPSYLIHMDGKSGIIKNTMLRWRSPIESNQHHPSHRTGTNTKNHTTNANTTHMNVKDYVNDIIIPPVVDAVIEAIDIGKHGYAAPITISFYIGSEHGRHRCVVTCEYAATILRKLLRTNHNNRFQCPISVGCRHRDIQQQKQQNHHTTNIHPGSSKKQKAFEDD